MNLVQCLRLTVALTIHQVCFCKELTHAVAPTVFPLADEPERTIYWYFGRNGNICIY
jgi:hypothetical protein